MRWEREPVSRKTTLRSVRIAGNYSGVHNLGVTGYVCLQLMLVVSLVWLLHGTGCVLKLESILLKPMYNSLMSY